MRDMGKEKGEGKRLKGGEEKAKWQGRKGREG